MNVLNNKSVNTVDLAESAVASRAEARRLAYSTEQEWDRDAPVSDVRGLRVSNPAPVVDQARIARAVREILLSIGEDPAREGLRETPSRVARAYAEMFSGIADDARRHLSRTFEHAGEQPVVVGGIDFSSVCEHHLLPFFGTAHIAYLPDGRVAGLSKLARTVDVFARRPQLQERLTEQVAQSIYECISPCGVCVLVEAEHLCMRVRGAGKVRASTRTLAARGTYADDAAARAEVLSLIRNAS